MCVESINERIEFRWRCCPSCWCRGSKGPKIMQKMMQNNFRARMTVGGWEGRGGGHRTRGRALTEGCQALDFFCSHMKRHLHCHGCDWRVPGHRIVPGDDAPSLRAGAAVQAQVPPCPVVFWTRRLRVNELHLPSVSSPQSAALHPFSTKKSAQQAEFRDSGMIALHDTS